MSMFHFRIAQMILMGLISCLVGLPQYAEAMPQSSDQKSTAKAPANATKGVAESEQPKFKAIWEPVNVKADLELVSVKFISPDEGWVAGGRTGTQGGVILHTRD